MTKTIDYNEQIKEILYETIDKVTEKKLHSMLINQNYEILNDIVFPSLEKIKKLKLITFQSFLPMLLYP